MKRSKKYEKLRNNSDSESSHLKKQCYNLIDRIVKTGEINRKDLLIALAIRLRLPINNCYINDFDLKTLQKAVRELEDML